MIFWIIGIVLGMLFVILATASVIEAVEKRHAWNLWAADLISDSELLERIGK